MRDALGREDQVVLSVVEAASDAQVDSLAEATQPALRV
jgi:hypothetical protein